MDYYIKDIILQERFKQYRDISTDKKTDVLCNLSKINIFVGANNSGKSRFLRALASTEGLSYIPPIEFADIGEFNRSKEEFSNSLNNILSKCGIQGMVNFGDRLHQAQIGYDVCQGTLSFTGWVWAGIGYEVGHTFFGPSYSWSGSYTVSGGPHANCGKCACCGSDGAGWSSTSDWNIVAPFLTELGARENVGAGLVITPDKCGVGVEGIVLIDLIKGGAAGPIGMALPYAAGFVGGRASAGVQLNVDVHFCHGASGGVVVDKASIAGGAFVDIGKTDKDGLPTFP